ncbi:hypothetical protein [Lentzea sp. CA-135723]|uniref:hypothetical protein n=1 Tax=Lentzea sp. CA-135723 TaxID=3239950 RepID=UPI003D8DFCF4
MVDQPGDGALVRVRWPDPFHRSRRARRVYLPIVIALAAGLCVLVPNKAIYLGWQTVQVVDGNVGSKKVLFDDEVIRDRLLTSHLRVTVTPKGSRAGVTSDLSGVDFVFPSGQPAAIKAKAQKGARQNKLQYMSPVVIATFRKYVTVLEKEGVVTPQVAPANTPSYGKPIYYNLDVEKLVELMRKGAKWKDLDPALGENRVLVETGDLCDANHAGAWLAMLAYVENGKKVVTSPDKAEETAGKLKDLLLTRGMSKEDLHALYRVPEGEQSPLIVMYEHLFLDLQLDAVDRDDVPDLERVMLYPNPSMESQPQLVSFTEKGHRLGKVLDEDEPIRRRALELGFRLVDDKTGLDSRKLAEYLVHEEVPVPDMKNAATTVASPDEALLEVMIKKVLDGVRTCPE